MYKNKKILSFDIDFADYGKLRSKGFTSDESLNRLNISEKIKNLNRRKR